MALRVGGERKRAPDRGVAFVAQVGTKPSAVAPSEAEIGLALSLLKSMHDPEGEVMNARQFCPWALVVIFGSSGVAACNQEPAGSDDASGGAKTGGRGGGTGGRVTTTGGRSAGGGDGTGGRRASGGMGGGAGEGGAGGCTPEEYDLESLCESPNFSGGFVDASIPEDPLNSPLYECTSERPEVSFADGETALFVYSEGCGRAQWRLDSPVPPGFSLVWRLDTEELLGCSYEEDVPLADQCGGFVRHAGQAFACEASEDHFCLLQGDSAGGAGGGGP
jgi:hypothetical protein